MQVLLIGGSTGPMLEALEVVGDGLDGSQEDVSLNDLNYSISLALWGVRRPLVILSFVFQKNIFFSPTFLLSLSLPLSLSFSLNSLP